MLLIQHRLLSEKFTLLPVYVADRSAISVVEVPSLRDGTGKEIRALHDMVTQHLRALKSLATFKAALRERCIKNHSNRRVKFVQRENCSWSIVTYVGQYRQNRRMRVPSSSFTHNICCLRCTCIHPGEQERREKTRLRVEG